MIESSMTVLARVCRTLVSFKVVGSETSSLARLYRALSAFCFSVFMLTSSSPVVAQDCTRNATPNDARCDFEASFFVGTVIDSFAADELNRYLNPEDSSAVKQSYVAGVDFAYRATRLFGGELFVFGETVHGKRSADVNCKEDPNVAVCKAEEEKGTITQDQFLYLLRNAITQRHRA
jgi:hypothetical protein